MLCFLLRALLLRLPLQIMLCFLLRALLLRLPLQVMLCFLLRSPPFAVTARSGSSSSALTMLQMQSSWHDINAHLLNFNLHELFSFTALLSYTSFSLSQQLLSYRGFSLS
jgi:urea transporter